MQLVDDVIKSTTKNAVSRSGQAPKPAGEESCVSTAMSLLSNIVETACEREPDLDLMRFINFLDLYRVYVEVASQPESDLHAYLSSISGPSDAVLTQKLGETHLVSFERFVRDSRLINIAATAASRETGEHVAAPPPLTISANG